MDNLSRNVNQSQDAFKDPQIPQIMYHLDIISRNVKEIVETKKQAMFEHGTLMTNIFD